MRVPRDRKEMHRYMGERQSENEMESKGEGVRATES
jgi:hypothetical protein